VYGCNEEQLTMRYAYGETVKKQSASFLPSVLNRENVINQTKRRALTLTCRHHTNSLRATCYLLCFFCCCFRKTWLGCLPYVGRDLDAGDSDGAETTDVMESELRTEIRMTIVPCCCEPVSRRVD